MPLSALVASAALKSGSVGCPQDFRNALRSPGRVLDGLVLQLLILPGLALLMSRLLGLPPAYALG